MTNEEKKQEHEQLTEKLVATTPPDAFGRKFAFYGTLRKGQGNYARLVANAKKYSFEGKRVLPGYRMYSFGGFPFVVNTGNPEDTIVVELYDINDEMVSRSIHRMEVGAGYGVEEVPIDGTNYVLYVYPSERDYAKRGFPAIPGGDWVDYYTTELKRRRKEQQFDF